MSWYHGKQVIKDIKQFPEGTFGFVYMITNLDTMEFYIGRKQLEQKVTRPPLKGQKKKRVEFKESKWIDYQSSNKDVQAWTNVEKVILTLAFSKIGLTYFETKALFCLGALEEEKCLNGNINGKYYKDKIQMEKKLFEDSKKIKLPSLKSIPVIED
jgi:hypothetical protein